MSEDIADSQNKENKNGYRPVFLLLIDGWGIAPLSQSNAISLAQPKNFLNLIKNYPVALLKEENKIPGRRYWSLGSGQPAGSDFYPQADYFLSKIISEAGYRQLKISSAHSFSRLAVLFNGGQEDPCLGEERILTGKDNNFNSEEDSRLAVKEALQALDSDDYDFISLSLPIIDQAVATGDFKEIIRAVKTVDRYLLKISNKVLNQGGTLIVVSPFGNAEQAKDLNYESPDRQPTANPVPVIIISEEFAGKTIGLADPPGNDLSFLSPEGDLTVIAPTVIKLLGMEASPNMKVKSLI